MSTQYKPDDILTTEELAMRWGLRPATLEWYRSVKKGPPYIKAPGVGVRYKFSDILSYEEQHVRRSETSP